MGVAVDDLDASEQRIDAAHTGCVIDLADVTAGRPAFGEPVPLRVVDDRLHHGAGGIVFCHERSPSGTEIHLPKDNVQRPAAQMDEPQANQTIGNEFRDQAAGRTSSAGLGPTLAAMAPSSPRSSP